MVILRGEADDYDGRRPTADDIGLIIELADGSLKIDTGAKLVAYAKASIKVYWVFNLKENVIYVYSDPIPSEGRYAITMTISRGESIPFILNGAQIALIAASDLLPIR
jgi:Uma2 family endonuclease